ncbi:hypothetical protein [Marinilabilia salmonicolor]|uniref:hypothetical protein n=1 Tax=Marinilabilia salmonicolor TaxID=989 RepID=UPI00046A9127|nr:hypothetical protein [Marinilabilia salmonicolor]
MMMSEEHTDNLFKELDRFDIQPSEQVWANIDARLGQKKKRVVPLFWRWGMAASVLLLAGLFLWMPGEELRETAHLTGNQNASENRALQPSMKKTEDLESSEEVVAALSGPESYEFPEVSGKTEEKIKKSDEPVDAQLLLALSSEPVQVAEDVLSVAEDRQKSVLQKIRSNTFVRLSESAVEPGELMKLSDKNVPEYFGLSLPQRELPEKSSGGIVLSGEYSPTYAYRDVSGSAASGMNESGLMTSGGGFNIAVKMNSRWQIETGVKYAMLGQEVTPQTEMRSVYGMADFSAENSVTLQEVQLNNSLGVIERDVSPAINSDVREFQNVSNAIVEMKSETSFADESSVLEQNLSYLQVPFTLRYQLLQQGPVLLSLAGGVGANWLVDNAAYLEMGGQRQNVGQTGGVAGLSFSTHAGVAVSVPLYRGLGIRMEPRVNYFLSDISEDAPGKFRPYSFGVFTGLFYEW